MVERIKTDLLILGGGSGGLSAAAGAAQMGADVVLLEGHKMGGDCLNYGCVPSKSLLAAAKAAHAMSAGSAFGIAPVAPQVDFAAANAHVRNVIKGIEPHDSVERFEGLGVKVISEYGHFVSPTVVASDSHESEARRIVIATGAVPFVPPIPGLNDGPFLTNESLFDLTDLPEHLIVIGAGPIGLEMAQAHRRLGSKVTVLEAGKALGKDDPEAAGLVLEKLRAEGIDIREYAAAENEVWSDGGVTVEPAGDAVTGSQLLVAVGRSPALERLNLTAAGVEHSAKGVRGT
mgnify:CR=1 FL=1